MAKLNIRLLGPIQFDGIDEPLSGFDSDKVRALLAYLVLESSRSHRREFLAGLFWPDFSERSARTNLRRALANLRDITGDRQTSPPFFNITRQTIQFNIESDFWLDASVFSQHAANEAGRKPESVNWEAALHLIRGEFMEGFSLADCVAFEEWLRINREMFRSQELQLMDHLVAHHGTVGSYDKAIYWANRQLALDPYREEAQQQLMRCLALSGRRSDALLLYEESRQTLLDDLGVEPAPETLSLYKQIRSGRLSRDALDFREPLVRGYELRERLGSGRFGAVYRAFQPVVKRDVAVKIILPDLANRPDFIRRFEAEAQIVARLEHPHIVPLYDYWRDPQGAYLVMRWLRGGSLQTDLKQGPWILEAAVNLIDQIAGALSAAHRQGIVHRDIKPANILLDENRNAYLSDFGIAAMVGPYPVAKDPPQAELDPSSPEYQSPEAISGYSPTPAVDIYSLGIVLYELLAGEPPFSDVKNGEMMASQLKQRLPPVTANRPELPSAVDKIIQKATAKDPAARYNDPINLAADLRRAVHGPPKSIVVPAQDQELRNPYKGLRPFQEADQADFFGREEAVAQLLASMQEENTLPFLAVVGPSGSGKSSLVKAGLIPALRKGALTASQDWFYLEMTPGSHPFEHFEGALLRIAVNPPESLLGQLDEDERGLLRAVRRSLPDDDCRLLLFIDQFEELFTLTKSKESQERFLKSLVTAVRQEGSPIFVLITLRADYFDRPLLYGDMGQLLQQRSKVVLPLSAAELERAVAAPAEQVGVELETGLLAEIVDDVRGQPGSLPLLQFALTELFEHRENFRLTRASYHANGGVLGALGGRAESLYQELGEQDQQVARQLLLRMIHLGEGAEPTRRKVLLSELESLSPEGDSSGTPSFVIDRLGHYRLLTFDRDPQSRTPTVEIAHEALIRQWHRLARWIDDGREELIAHRRLAAAAVEWEQSDRDSGFLLRGSRLDSFIKLQNETDISLVPVEQDYLDASLFERNRRLEEERTRLEREQGLERRSRTFLRMFAAVLALAAAIAIVLAGYAVSQRNAAEEQARLSMARELAKSASESLNVDPELSILLGLEAVNQTYEADSLVVPEAEEVLHQAIQTDRMLRTITSTESSAGRVLFSHDGRQLVTWFYDDIPGNTRIVDPVSGEEQMLLAGVVPIALTSDAGFLVSGHPDFASFQDIYTVWDLDNGTKLRTYSLPFSTGIPISHNVNQDLTHFVRTLDNGVTEIWNLEPEPEVIELGSAGRPPDLTAAFSPDGRILATGNVDGSVALWSVENGELLHSLAGHEGNVNQVAFSPDGQLLASAGGDGAARLWNPETGELLSTLAGHTNELLALAFSHEGDLLATTGWDRKIKLWDVNTSLEQGFGLELHDLAGHKSAVYDVAFSLDSSRLASASQDGLVKIWDITAQGGQEALLLVNGRAPGSEWLATLSLSPDGAKLAAANADSTPRIWDTQSGELLQVLVGHQDVAEWIEFAPDGDLVVSAGHDGTLRGWDVSTGEELFTVSNLNCLPLIGKAVGCDLAISPDQGQLAVTDGDGLLRIYDLSDLLSGSSNAGLPIVDIAAHDGSWTFDVAFSPDGNQVATTSEDQTIKVWDAETAELIHTLRAHLGWIFGVVYSPDGTSLLSTSADRTAILWDVETGQLILTLTGHEASVLQGAFSPDGEVIATASSDGTVKLWNAQNGHLLLTLRGHTSGVTDVAFSPDGARLYTAGQDGTNRAFILDIKTLLTLARSRVSRSLSAAECQQFLHTESCPDPGR